MAKFELPPLPYPYNALEPQISEETMHYHHDKHHKAYVDKLNELIEGTQYEDVTLEEIIQKSDGAIFNNAAQVWNHTFFFETLSPDPKQNPEGALADAIDRDFGSLDQLAAQLKQAGVGQFGSGWAWLVKDSFGKLTVKATPNAVNPLKDGKKQYSLSTSGSTPTISTIETVGRISSPPHGSGSTGMWSNRDTTDSLTYRFIEYLTRDRGGAHRPGLFYPFCGMVPGDYITYYIRIFV